jgi:ankyrin repeat protein
VDVKSSNFPLIEAIQAQHLNVVKFLVENGMNPNKQTSTTSFPLFEASKLARIEFVKYLLEIGCDPNEKHEKTGSTCLMEAAKKLLIEICRILLQYGADMNLMDKSNHTSLYYAIQKQFPDVVNLLLNTDKDLELFLHQALRLYRKEIIEILIYYGFEINEQDSNGDSTLMLAIKNHPNFSSLLMERGVNIYLRNNKNENAMIFAVRTRENICRDLFMNGASLDSGIRGNDLLWISVTSWGRDFTSQFLMENGEFDLGFDDEYVEKFKETDAYTFLQFEFDYKTSTIPIKDLLYYSIVYNRFNVFMDLIWKIDQDQMYWGGNGILHLCIIYVRNEMFYYLIEKFSMNFLWRNEDNLLPIDIAIKKGNEELTMKLCHIHGNIYPIDSNFFKCSRIHEDIWDQLQCWKIFKSCQSRHDIGFKFN